MASSNPVAKKVLTPPLRTWLTEGPVAARYPTFFFPALRVQTRPFTVPHQYLQLVSSKVSAPYAVAQTERGPMACQV